MSRKIPIDYIEYTGLVECNGTFYFEHNRRFYKSQGVFVGQNAKGNVALVNEYIQRFNNLNEIKIAVLKVLHGNRSIFLADILDVGISFEELQALINQEGE